MRMAPTRVPMSKFQEINELFVALEADGYVCGSSNGSFSSRSDGRQAER
jgi:hypothetical protein